MHPEAADRTQAGTSIGSIRFFAAPQAIDRCAFALTFAADAKKAPLITLEDCHDRSVCSRPLLQRDNQDVRSLLFSLPKGIRGRHDDLGREERTFLLPFVGLSLVSIRALHLSLRRNTDMLIRKPFPFPCSLTIRMRTLVDYRRDDNLSLDLRLTIVIDARLRFQHIHLGASGVY